MGGSSQCPELPEGLPHGQLALCSPILPALPHALLRALLLRLLQLAGAWGFVEKELYAPNTGD